MPKEMISGSKNRTKTLILARHGMLECGKNFRGTMPEVCRHCNMTDNENHRLNDCINRMSINHADICNFHDIYSNDDVVLTQIIKNLESVWEFRYANGKMKRE